MTVSMNSRTETARERHGKADRSFHALVSPGFVACTSLLILNDFVLKQHFHNELTGKLSDFAGLFVFPFFWATLVPRLKTTVYLSTALSFILWKSIYAQPLIEALNLMLPFSIGRTVDPTDLLALLVLPASYRYRSAFNRCRSGSSRKQDVHGARRRQLAVCGVGAISLFAFTATTYEDDQTISYAKEYEFNVPKQELVRGLFDTDLDHVDRNERVAMLEGDETEFYTGVLDKKICKTKGLAFMDVHARGAERSVLELDFVLYSCDYQAPEHEREFLAEFERAVVDVLREKFGS